MELLVKCVSKTKVEINGVIFDTVKHRKGCKYKHIDAFDGTVTEHEIGKDIHDPIDGCQCIHIVHPKGEAYFRVSFWNYDKIKKLIKKYLNTFKKQYI